MSGWSFSIRTFLDATGRKYLQAYFAKKSVFTDFDFDWHRDDWQKELTDVLEKDAYGNIKVEMGEIHKLACDSGVELLNEQAARDRIKFDGLFRSMRSHHQRVMWTYLRHEEIFERALGLFYVDHIENWKVALVGHSLPCAVDDSKIASLGKAIGKYFKSKGKGSNCEVDYYYRRDPDRHCYFAYPEDYLKRDVVYNKSGSRSKKASQRAFEVVFIYTPSEGILRVHRQRGGAVQELQDIFCQYILGLSEGLPDENKRVYGLSCLLKPDYRFTYDIEDGVELVKLKMVEVDLAGGYGQRICLQAIPRGSDRVVFDMLQKTLQAWHCNVAHTVVRRAKIQVKFQHEPGKRQKQFTLNVACPDSDNLKDEPHHNVIRKLLKKWGVLRKLKDEANGHENSQITSCDPASTHGGRSWQHNNIPGYS